MKSQNKLFLPCLAVLALAVCQSGIHAQDHGHLNVGVEDTDNSGTANAGDKIEFKNGNDWAYDFLSESGYVHNATTGTTGAAANYYGGSAQTFAITPSALAGNSGRQVQTIGGGGAVTYRAWESFGATANGSLAVAGASTGAFIQLKLVSITLLSGDATSFSFWGPSSGYPGFSGTTPTAEWTFSGTGAGTLAIGTNTIDLTAINTRVGDGIDTTFPGSAPSYPTAFTGTQSAEGYRWNVDYNGGSYDVSTAVDPYGHIHGRSWAVNGSAELEMVWQAVDANGVQTDSDQFTMKWQAVPEPSVYALMAVGAAAFYVLRRKRRADQPAT